MTAAHGQMMIGRDSTTAHVATKTCLKTTTHEDVHLLGRVTTVARVPNSIKSMSPRAGILFGCISWNMKSGLALSLCLTTLLPG